MSIVCWCHADYTRVYGWGKVCKSFYLSKEEQGALLAVVCHWLCCTSRPSPRPASLCVVGPQAARVRSCDQSTSMVVTSSGGSSSRGSSSSNRGSSTSATNHTQPATPFAWDGGVRGTGARAAGVHQDQSKHCCCRMQSHLSTAPTRYVGRYHLTSRLRLTLSAKAKSRQDSSTCL